MQESSSAVAVAQDGEARVQRGDAAIASEATPSESAVVLDQVRPLWTAKDAALFLRKSLRWVFYALRLPDTAPGSIPHVRVGRAPRFDPAVIAEWVNAGCPPVAAFRAWQMSPRRRKTNQ